MIYKTPNTQNKYYYLRFTFYLLVFVLIIFFIIYISNQFFKPELTFGKSSFDSFLLIVIIISIIIIVPILTILTVKEYKNYLKRQSQGSHNFKNQKLAEIFENEIRKKIIKAILENPGIHTNELLRELDLAKGQLQWHLEILLSNNIIKTKKLGQYTTFYSKLKNNHLDYTKILISKSDTTSNILYLIKKNPGINSKTISETLNLSRSSVKYHIDKLVKNKIIFFHDAGNEKKLYFNRR
ncbi:MAG: winged helix-turn-helix transcriptional regulator [Candidatus Lokiarchaeota archaeon]|nr:winged helix-turn-helix transcriptional regulator [Candidatus Lokiarchaeota archaeon]MBD3202415.1 winged helix-turn-helix transcriptional regulator [Candidatus Lokiarchaeota archaeon]